MITQPDRQTIADDLSRAPQKARSPPHPQDSGAHRSLGRRVMIIGDGTAEIEAGKAAGIRSIAVTYGAIPRADLEAAEPDWILSGIGELVTLVP
ncbi:MAG: HAD hydrolase-like protein [SAR324 cluster bacterium]|nr:HAD hydrolase-like protein [SAR324 cluster bacterium]